jgi:hypothetical protein
MGVIELYSILAIATTLIALWELYFPVMQALKGENLNVVNHAVTTYIVFIAATLLFAPFVLPSCIVPSYGERFRAALERSFRKS